MSRSGAHRAAVVVVDLAARLAVPGSLLALVHDRATFAVAAGALVSALAVLRGLLHGALLEREVRALWSALVATARRLSVSELSARPPEQNVAMLVAATRGVAVTNATVLPRMAAEALGVAVVAVGVAFRLGPMALAAGAAICMPVALMLWFAQRSLRSAARASFREFDLVSRDLGAVFDGAIELRAHGREALFYERIDSGVGAMAAKQRREQAISALVGLFPLGIALAAIALPLRTLLAPTAVSLAEVGIWGAAGLVLAVGLARSAEAYVRIAPQRELLQRFLGSKPAQPRAEDTELDDLDDVLASDVTFDSVAVRYPGNDVATPADFTCTWRQDRGLALVGPNGSGKSTIALVVLGLHSADQGQLSAGGRRLPPGWLARRPGFASFLPQAPFVAPQGTLAWHCGLVGDVPTEAALHAALSQVGLLERLRNRAGRRGCQIADLRAGELSGGELRRFFLARALVGEAALVVLDEPDAGLDAAGKALLPQLLQQLAARARVLVIVHDASVLPKVFDQVDCSVD